MLLLAQGLVRDVVTLYLERASRPDEESPPMLCLCVESTVGLAGIVAGVVLSLAGLGGALNLSVTLWTVAAAVVLGVGLAIRDWVVKLRPLRIVHVPNHGSIRVSLK